VAQCNLHKFKLLERVQENTGELEPPGLSG